MENLFEKLNESAAYINGRTGNMKIRYGLVLGSGLGDLADSIENPIVIPYKDIPHFAVSTAPGHAGQLVIGSLEGVNVMCMQGRLHFYEGWTMEQVVYPVQVMKILGLEGVVLTNAGGCVNTSWNEGDLMIIKDHIKLVTHESPFRGPNDERLGPRFFDMSTAYTPKYREVAKKVASEQNLTIREGVYMYFAGPNFETPAEVRAAGILGADAVGMSTVPEVIAAAHCGLNVLGISCLTNMAAGLGKPLDHVDVLATGKKVKSSFIALLKGILKEIA